MPRGGYLLEDLRVVRRVQADGKKDGLGAVRGERGQYRWGILWPRPVVEGEHYLAFAQEVMGLEMLKAESGATRANTLLTVWACQRCGILLAKLDYHLYLDRNVENQ